MAQYGRDLYPEELEASNNYHTVLNAYDETHNVKMYDRVSIHKAFPEINEAFEKMLAATTFCRLKYGSEDEEVV